MGALQISWFLTRGDHSQWWSQFLRLRQRLLPSLSIESCMIVYNCSQWLYRSPSCDVLRSSIRRKVSPYLFFAHGSAFLMGNDITLVRYSNYTGNIPVSSVTFLGFPLLVSCKRMKAASALPTQVTTHTVVSRWSH